jgi:hypothetical protein
MTKTGRPPKNRLTPENSQRVVNEYKNDDTDIRELAEKYETTYYHIRAILLKANALKPSGWRRAGFTRKGKYNISPPEFIKIWQTASTLDEVCEKTKMSKSSAYSRAAGYRKRGIPLQKFSRAKKTDWETLADLAQLYADEKEDA